MNQRSSMSWGLNPRSSLSYWAGVRVRDQGADTEVWKFRFVSSDGTTRSRVAMFGKIAEKHLEVLRVGVDPRVRGVSLVNYAIYCCL
jgi:hypothetical protein